MNPLVELRRLGQSIWLDSLSRTLLQEGGLKRLIQEDGISGVTSNPSIFHKAVSESPYYRGDLAALQATPAAFRAHGRALPTLETGVAEAEAHFLALAQLGIDMHAVGEQLQQEGVRLFDEAYDQLLKRVA